MIYTLTSEEWRQKYIDAQTKIDELLVDIDVQRAENDRDKLELSSQRLKDAYTYRDDCEQNYYDALEYEKNNNINRVTYMRDSRYGY